MAAEAGEGRAPEPKSEGAQACGCGDRPDGAIEVEIVWVADDQRVERRRCRLEAQATVALALATLASPERERLLGEISLGRLRTAIYGELCESDARLRAGDRVELLAALALDPKTARRMRVAQRRAGSPGKWSRSR